MCAHRKSCYLTETKYYIWSLLTVFVTLNQVIQAFFCQFFLQHPFVCTPSLSSSDTKKRTKYSLLYTTHTFSKSTSYVVSGDTDWTPTWSICHYLSLTACMCKFAWVCMGMFLYKTIQRDCFQWKAWLLLVCMWNSSEKMEETKEWQKRECGVKSKWETKTRRSILMEAEKEGEKKGKMVHTDTKEEMAFKLLCLEKYGPP